MQLVIDWRKLMSDEKEDKKSAFDSFTYGLGRFFGLIIVIGIGLLIAMFFIFLINKMWQLM